MLRHLLKTYKMFPWQWDENYPEEMEGKMFPEDRNTLVQIDMKLDNRERLKNNVSEDRRDNHRRLGY